MSDVKTRLDEIATHPMFDGRPILVGDEIDISGREEDEDGGWHGLYTAVVSTIRMVRGVPWIHVLEPANDYVDHVHERNEIIVAQQEDGGGRYVVGHRPKRP